MKKSVFVLFMSLGLALLVLGGGKEVKSSSVAPDFSANDIDGNPVTLSGFRGQVVVLDFWATWCPPCRMAIPEMVKLQKKYRDQGVVILGLSMDDPQRVNDESLRAFMKKFTINYTILRGTGEVARKYFGGESFYLPTVFIINRKGEVVDKHVGYYPGAVEKSLKKLLK